VTLLVLFLASYSVAWTLAIEKGPFGLSKKMRDAADSRFGEESWVAEGLSCPICLGFWVALGLFFVPTGWLFPFAAHGLIILAHNWVMRGRF
jgi:hypothetical protein